MLLLLLLLLLLLTYNNSSSSSSKVISLELYLEKQLQEPLTWFITVLRLMPDGRIGKHSYTMTINRNGQMTVERGMS